MSDPERIWLQPPDAKTRVRTWCAERIVKPSRLFPDMPCDTEYIRADVYAHAIAVANEKTKAVELDKRNLAGLVEGYRKEVKSLALQLDHERRRK